MTFVDVFNLVSPFVLLVAASFGLGWWSHYTATRGEAAARGSSRLSVAE